MRMGGLASGMDTESIIGAMLEVERIPQYRLEAEIATKQDKIAAWTDLDVAVSSLYSTTKSLTSYSTWQQMKVTSSATGVLGASALYTATPATYDIRVDHLAAAHRIATDAQASTAAALNLSGDFTLNGQAIAVAATDTLANLRDKINTASQSMADIDKVSATIVNTSLVIKRAQTGSTELSLTDGAEGVLKSLGLLAADDTVKHELQAATGLLATVDGIEVQREANTDLTDVLNGVTLNFQAEGDTVLTVGHDTESIRALIEDFIAAYNQAMEAAETHTHVTLGSEAISSKGVLQGENLVNTLQYRSRSLLTASETNPGILDQAFNSLQSIGIWTAGRDNRLQVTDSQRLTEALSGNFEKVEDLFRDYDSGIARKLDTFLDTLVSPIDGALAKRSENLQNEIEDAYDRIDAIDVRITALETQLWEQFGRMEDALAGINQQASYLLALAGQTTNANSSSSKK